MYNDINDINTRNKKHPENCSLQSLLYMTKFIQPNHKETFPSDGLALSALSFHPHLNWQCVTQQTIRSCELLVCVKLGGEGGGETVCKRYFFSLS